MLEPLLINRIRLQGKLVFDTAFHLGSGSSGELASDMGVLVDYTGTPLLPGSSLKGVFRSTAERLAEYLGLRTCFLDRHSPWCPGGNQKLGKQSLQRLAEAQSTEGIEEILEEQCDTCRLFGSSLAKGKLYFADAACVKWAGIVELRDGVGIDRDSGTAVPQVKYDYDVIPRGATFDFTVLGENLSSIEESLLSLVIFEWQRGVRLGGMTSRGLGAATLQDLQMRKVELGDPQQRIAYLLDDEMQPVDLDGLKRDLRTQLQSKED